MTPDEIAFIALNDLRKNCNKWHRLAKRAGLSKEEASYGFTTIFMSVVLKEAHGANINLDEVHGMLDRLIVAIADGCEEKVTLQ